MFKSHENTMKTLQIMENKKKYVQAINTVNLFHKYNIWKSTSQQVNLHKQNISNFTNESYFEVNVK